MVRGTSRSMQRALGIAGCLALMLALPTRVTLASPAGTATQRSAGANLSIRGTAREPVAAPILLAMSAELDRSLQTLKAQPVPPYFLSYQVSESRETIVAGAFGTLQSSSENRWRTLTMDMRVGSPAFDNSHAVRGGLQSMDFGERFERVLMPVEDDPGTGRRHPAGCEFR